MNRTIKALWGGDIAVGERCGAGDLQLRELLSVVRKHKENLNQSMSAQQQEAFEKYIDSSNEYLYSLLEHAFCDGFCLAGKLFSEALSGGK